METVTKSNENCVTVKKEKSVPWLCEFCGKQCSNLHSLSIHRKRAHFSVKKIFTCDICWKTFRDSFNLKRHIACVHEGETAKCRSCNAKFKSQDLCKHLEEQHGSSLEEETLVFKDIEEFKVWKENMEKETKSKYVRHRAPRVTKSGVTAIQLFCYRDGFFHSKGQNKRRMKFTGSVKMDSHCLSKICVKEYPDKVIVDFTKTHTGHSVDTDPLNLPKPERKRKRKLSFKSDTTDTPTKKEPKKKIMEQKVEALEKLKSILDKVNSREKLEAVMNQIAPLEEIVTSKKRTKKDSCDSLVKLSSESTAIDDEKTVSVFLENEPDKDDSIIINTTEEEACVSLLVLNNTVFKNSAVFVTQIN